MNLPHNLAKLILPVIVCAFDISAVSAVQDHGDSTAAESDAGWVEMFNGKSLEGWTQKNGWASYRVEDGAIVGTTAQGSPNSFLCSVKEYGDFELEFEVQCDSRLNSGVQIRSQTKDDGSNPFQVGRVNGPQVEIEASGENGAEAGYLYAEAAGGWMLPGDKRVPHRHFKDGEWNHYRVIARGPRIQTFVNGQPVCDLEHAEMYRTHASGFVGLQVHGVGNGGPFEVRWRNLKIRELEE